MFFCEKKGENPGPASVASTIHWAETQNRQVDMFVILSNYMVETAGARAAINKYRSNMKLPNAKYVLFCMSFLFYHNMIFKRNEFLNSWFLMSSTVLILILKKKQSGVMQNTRVVICYLTLMREKVRWYFYPSGSIKEM